MVADGQIDTLEAKGLIRVATYRPELEYLFRHWLVQDAAYESLLKQERRQLHRLVGEALENLYPDRNAELSGILAMHFEQAGDTVKAVDYYVADGEYALKRAALREAFAAFDSALRLLPPDDAGLSDDLRRRRVEVELKRAKAGWTFRGTDEVSTELAATVAGAERLGDLLLEAEVHTQLALVRTEAGVNNADPSVKRSLDRLAEISLALDDPSLAALPVALAAMNKVFTGPIREGVEALEEAIPLIEKRGDTIGAAFSRGWLAIGYGNLGDFPKADEASRKAVELAVNGDLISQLDAQIAQASVRAARGDLDEAAPLARACVERAEETGATACAVVSTFILGDVYQRQGRFEEARQALTLGLDLAPGYDPGAWGPTLNAWLRANPPVPADLDASAREWEEALAFVDERGNHMGRADILRKRAEAAERSGHLDLAIPDYEASAAIYEAQGARPALARVVRAWGVALRASGRAAEGDERLRRARALFEEMGLAREAEQVSELLGAAAGG